MIGPKLTISLFAIKTKKALVKSTDTRNVFAENGNPDMGTVVKSYIANMRDHGDPRYMTFTAYTKNHKKDDIQSCSAIMLEYPYANKVELLEKLNELPFIYYLIDTQSDFDAKAEARILVAFPLETAITKPSDYTRTASLLWDEIGISAHTQGSISSTFLFAPYFVNPGVKLVSQDRAFLGHTAYMAANEDHWVKVDEAKQPNLTLSEDGLFEFPAAR